MIVGTPFLCTFVAISTLNFSRDVIAEPESSEGVGFHYDLLFFLAYLGVASKPNIVQIKPDYNLAAIAPENMMEFSTTPRTLGLRQFKTVMTWEALSNAKVSVVLRPDAINRYDEGEDKQAMQTVCEFDIRAGDVYRSPATIRFLDAYQIATTTRNLGFGVGVWEELAK